jgi:hypothetical protein
LAGDAIVAGSSFFRRTKMKILLFQATPVFGNPNANLQTIENTCQIAGDLGVDIAIFPELFVSGYNLGARLHELAERADGPNVSRLCNIAKSSGVAIIAGYPERRDGKFFNSAIAISNRGDILGQHNKVFLFGDDEKKLFSPGNGFPVFERTQMWTFNLLRHRISRGNARYEKTWRRNHFCTNSKYETLFRRSNHARACNCFRIQRRSVWLVASVHHLLCDRQRVVGAGGCNGSARRNHRRRAAEAWQQRIADHNVGNRDIARIRDVKAIGYVRTHRAKG